MAKWTKEKVSRIKLFTVQENNLIILRVTNKVVRALKDVDGAEEWFPRVINEFPIKTNSIRNDHLRKLKKEEGLYEKSSICISALKQLGSEGTIGVLIAAMEVVGWDHGVVSLFAIDWDAIEGINKLLLPEAEAVPPKSEIKSADEPDLKKNSPNDIPELIPFNYQQAEKDLEDGNGHFQGQVLKVKVKHAEALKAGERIYKMDSKPRGVAFIINNMFKGLKGQRHGSELDVQYLGSLCKQLGFDVFEIHNVKSSQFPALMDRCRQSLNNNMDATIFAIMSHGKLNNIQMADGALLDLDRKILPELYNDKFHGNNESFKKKPKILIVQACQHLEDDKNDCFNISDSCDVKVKEAKYGEIHILLPCWDDTAKRRADTGSRFIYHLVEELMNNAKDTNLDEMMTNVTAKMKELELPASSEPQLPCIKKMGATKTLYFNPGK